MLLRRIRSLHSMCRIFSLLLFSGFFLTFLLRPAQAAEWVEDGAAKTKTIEVPFKNHDGFFTREELVMLSSRLRELRDAVVPIEGVKKLEALAQRAGKIKNGVSLLRGPRSFTQYLRIL